MTSLQGDLAIVSGGAMPPLVNSVWKLIETGYLGNPNGAAVIATHQRDDYLSSVVGKESPCNDRCLSWTFAEIRRGASRIAAAIEGRGVQRGTILITLLPNGAECSLFIWITAMLQLTLVPLDPGLLDTGREESLIYILKTLKPSSIVLAGTEEAETFDKATAELSESITAKIICRSEHSNPGTKWTTMEQLAKAGTVSDASIHIVQDENVDQEGHRTATILFTSGTSTGRPKGCPLSVLNLSLTRITSPTLFRMEKLTRVLIHNVNFRVIHLLTSLGAWCNAGTVVLAGETFSPRTTLDAIEAHTCSWMMCVPAQLQSLAEDETMAIRNLRSMRFLTISGDVGTDSYVEIAQKTFPQSVVRSAFGMTEGIGAIGWPRDVYGNAPVMSHVYSAGKVLAGATIKICDENTRVLKRGETGDLHISFAGMIHGYYEGEQPELFYEDKGDRWIITGDRAAIDGNGFIFVLGRNKDVIKHSGKPLSPALIETFVSSKTGIQSQAFGVPHDKFGEEPFLVIKDPDPLVSEGVAQLVASGLGADYVLKGVVSLDQLGFDDFPMNSTGKIMKGRLRESTIEYLTNLGPLESEPEHV